MTSPPTPSRLPAASMMRALAWWGTISLTSSSRTLAFSNAWSVAWARISVAKRKTFRPSIRISGRPGPSGPSAPGAQSRRGQRVLRRFRGEVGGGLVDGGDPALNDAGAVANPCIRRLDHLFEVGVRQDAGRNVAADRLDAGKHASPRLKNLTSIYRHCGPGYASSPSVNRPVSTIPRAFNTSPSGGIWANENNSTKEVSHEQRDSLVINHGSDVAAQRHGPPVRRYFRRSRPLENSRRGR